MVANAVCEITHQAGNRSAMMSASIPFVGGAIMLTKQKLSRIADVALLSLLVLEAVFVTAGIAISPASAQARMHRRKPTASFLRRSSPPPTRRPVEHSTRQPRGAKGWIALHRPD